MKKTSFLSVFLICLFGLTCCNANPEGRYSKQEKKLTHSQVKGVLLEKETLDPVVGCTLNLYSYKGINADGKPQIEYSIVEGKIKAPQTKTDNKGHFSFTDVSTGRYVISIIRIDLLSGGFVWIKQGEAWILLIVEIESGRSIDLGNVFVE